MLVRCTVPVNNPLDRVDFVMFVYEGISVRQVARNAHF
jgi:hypothetical protein